MLRGFGAKRLAGLLAAALTGALLPGGALAADVDITGNVTTGVNLDSSVGSTVEIAPGVSVSNAAGLRAVNATAAAWALINRGTVSSTITGYSINLDVAGSSVTNFGTITSGGSNGIVLFNGGSVDNKLGATLSAASNAISIGHTSGGGAGPGTVTNAGTITQTGTLGDVVTLLFGGTITNLSTGVITGNSSNAAVSIGQGASRTVVNSGTITNISTSANSAGLVVQGGASTVTNNLGGQISGYLNGIWANSSAPLTLTNAGTISSSRISGSAYAVEADGGGSITNTGTITSAGSSGVFMGGTSTLTNSGTITGLTNAITFSGNTSTHTLKLDSGSVLNGNVVGVSNIGATDNLVLLGTGTESAAKFLNFETLSMQGSAWTLTGNTNFATSGEIQAGVLTVGGNLTSPSFSILSGGTVTGTGTLTGAVANSGTVKVAAGQTFSIAGSTTFNTGSIFAVGVTPGTTGLLAVTGTANLAGTVNVLAGAGTYAPNTSYTILTATTSIAGTFSGLTSSSPFLTPSLVYNPLSVMLTLDRSLVSFASAGQTRNQVATGTALDTLPGTNAVVVPLATLSLADAARAFDQLSGEAYASVQAALANDSRYAREAAFDRVDAAFAAIDQLKAGRRPVWAQGFGGLSSIAGDGNAAPLGDATGGLLIGMDALLPDNSPVTLFGGFGASHFSIADRGSEVSAQSFHFGASAGREMNGFRLKGGLAGSLAGISVDRRASFTGFSETDSASYAEATGQLFAELSYAIAADSTTLEPFGRLALVGVSGGDYAESGGSAALKGHSDGYGLALATLGLSAGTDFALADDLTVHARGRIGLQQGFGAAPTATNQFDGSDSFTIAGTAAGGTTVLLEAELSAGLTPATDLSVGFSGAVGTSGSAGALTARLSGAF